MTSYESTQTETPPAFQEGINDPEGWANICREISDFAPKNALKKHAPKYSATVSLNYLDAANKPREILVMKATNPDDASDLVVLFAGLQKPGARRMIIVTPNNALSYEYNG